MSQAATVSVARAVGTSRASKVQLGSLVGLTYLWWTLIVFEWDRFLAAKVGGPWYRIPALFAPVLVLLLLRVLTGGRRGVYWPVAAFVLLHLAAIFYAENRGFVIASTKLLLYQLLTMTLLMTVADSPKRLVMLLKIFALGFIWYGVQGIPGGRVTWHQELNNEDSYGPFLCIGLGFCYYFALANPSRVWRLVGYVGAAVACIGVVASFARGAVIALVVTLLMVWLRSPRKVRTLLWGAVAVGVALVAIEVLFPGGAFWRRMHSVTEEGKDAGTGMVRWVMWGLALQLWQQHPIFGIGAANFGVVAAQTFPDDPSRPAFVYADYLWGQQLHNSYVQILCEEGLVGMAIFLSITFGFFRRVWRLRGKARLREWRRRGGELDLRFAALALELGMVGFLCNGLFYNQMYVHWYWSLLGLALALERCTEPSPPPAGAPPASREADPRGPAPASTPPEPLTASLGAALLRRGGANRSGPGA